MAYPRCDECGWTQDDFWSEDGYHPLRLNKDGTLNWLKEMLTEAMTDDDKRVIKVERELKEPFNNYNIPFREADGSIFVDVRQYIYFRLRGIGESIRRQHFMTWDDLEFEDRRCPECDSPLNID